MASLPTFIECRRSRRAWLGAGLAAGLAGFPGAPAWALMAGRPPDSPARRIVPPEPGSPWAAVGAVTLGTAVYSGVLIAPGWVLTAAHVAAGKSPADLRFRLDDGRGPVWRSVAEVRLHPRYTGFDRPPPFYDAALLRLGEDAPASVRPARPHYARLRIGTVLTFVGFGASGDGDQGVSVPARADTKRIGRNQVDRLIAPPGETRAGVFVYDFDPPIVDSRRARRGGAPGPRDGQGLGNLVETCAASGDSGAPAFAHRNALVGLLGFVAPDPAEPSVPALRAGPARLRVSRFGGIGGGTLIAPLREWIQAAV